MNIINLHVLKLYCIDFRYLDDFNYPDMYPDTRCQRGPDNRGSIVSITLKTVQQVFTIHFTDSFNFSGLSPVFIFTLFALTRIAV